MDSCKPGFLLHKWTRIFTAALLLMDPHWTQPKCPPKAERVNKRVCPPAHTTQPGGGTRPCSYTQHLMVPTSAALQRRQTPRAHTQLRSPKAGKVNLQWQTAGEQSPGWAGPGCRSRPIQWLLTFDNSLSGIYVIRALSCVHVILQK